jgi:hypothetical protein
MPVEKMGGFSPSAEEKASGLISRTFERYKSPENIEAGIVIDEVNPPEFEMRKPG